MKKNPLVFFQTMEMFVDVSSSPPVSGCGTIECDSGQLLDQSLDDFSDTDQSACWVRRGRGEADVNHQFFTNYEVLSEPSSSAPVYSSSDVTLPSDVTRSILRDYDVIHHDDVSGDGSVSSIVGVKLDTGNPKQKTTNVLAQGKRKFICFCTRKNIL